MKDSILLALIEETLEEVLPRPEERPAALSEAMRYAVGTKGKRIRPLICLGSAIAAGGCAEDAKYAAAAIELLHNYTLIHDDLPSMDNDEERRGNPTVWKKFGEANAILAGDALLSLSYAVAARTKVATGQIITVLGEKGVGVVKGQVEDISELSFGFESRKDDFVYLHKTADLFIAAAQMGALAAGGDDRSVAQLGDFAKNLGMAFQYQDDLLDGDGIFDRKRTTELAKEHTAAALYELKDLPGETIFLSSLASSLVGRTK